MNDSKKNNNKYSPWQSKKWKEVRENKVGKECIQCGSKENLNVHHLKPRTKYQEINSKAFYQIYNELKENKKLPLEKIEIIHRKSCPKCGTPSIRERKTLEPKFRCPYCKINFDQPSIIEKYNEKPLMSFVARNYKKEIADRIEKIREEEFKEYIDTDYVITLCKKCHYFYHQGKILCQVCKKRYHLAKYEMCWTCKESEMRKEGKILCRFCHEKFHNENEEACDMCSFMRSKFECSICKQLVFDVENFCYGCDLQGMCSDCAIEHENETNHETGNYL